MKAFILACAVSACCTGASPVQSASSFGGHTEATIAGINVFCQQSLKDHEATNEPMTGKLLELCTK